MNSKYVGYGPKSQTFIKGNKVMFLSLNQVSSEVSLYK